MKHIPHWSPKTWSQYLWLVIAFLLYQTQAALAQTSLSYCDASFTYTQKTNVCPPNAHCLLADNVEVSFTAKSANNQMYEWNFGDGETAKGETVTHRYFKPGKYEVSLFVYSPTVPWGTEGIALQVICADTKVQTIIIDSLEEPAQGVCSMDLQFKQNGNIVTPYEQYDYNKDLLKEVQTVYFWNFGDGTTSTKTFPTHTYAKPGKYTISVTKVSLVHVPELDSFAMRSKCNISAQGTTIMATCNYKETCRNTDSILVNLEPVSNSCMADIRITTSKNTITGTDAIITTADYRPWEVIHYYWNFGDGRDTSGLSYITHNYKKAGKYLVSVTKVQFNQSKLLNSKTGLDEGPCDYMIYDESIKYSKNGCLEEICRETYTQWVTITDDNLEQFNCNIPFVATQSNPYKVDFKPSENIYHLDDTSSDGYLSYLDFGDSTGTELRDINATHTYKPGRYLVKLTSIYYKNGSTKGDFVCAAFYYEPLLKTHIPCYYKEMCRGSYSLWISINENGKLVLDKEFQIIAGISPNPVENNGSLEILGANATLECNIYNTNGVLMKKISGVENGTNNFSSSELPNGLYIYTLTSDGKTVKRDKFSVRK